MFLFEVKKDDLDKVKSFLSSNTKKLMNKVSAVTADVSKSSELRQIEAEIALIEAKIKLQELINKEK